MLLDSPVSKVIVEWQAPKPHGYYLLFFAFAAGTAALAAWQRRRVGWYGVTILAVTLAGSLRSGRGIVWFTIAALVLLPAALDGAFGDRETPIRRRLGIGLASAFVLVLAASIVIVTTRSSSWFEKEWPAPAARVIAAAARTTQAQKLVFPTDKHADWLLWKIPSLRGRVAYDVRFELVTARELSLLVGYKTTRRGWQSVARGYQVLVFDPGEGKAQIRAARATAGARQLFANGSVVVLRRQTG
jgi:hypothetical protein